MAERGKKKGPYKKDADKLDKPLYIKINEKTKSKIDKVAKAKKLRVTTLARDYILHCLDQEK